MCRVLTGLIHRPSTLCILFVCLFVCFPLYSLIHNLEIFLKNLSTSRKVIIDVMVVVVVQWLSRVQLCHVLDCSLPGSSVHGILQARILEWVAISFSNRCDRINYKWLLAGLYKWWNREYFGKNAQDSSGISMEHIAYVVNVGSIFTDCLPPTSLSWTGL